MSAKNNLTNWTSFTLPPYTMSPSYLQRLVFIVTHLLQKPELTFSAVSDTFHFPTSSHLRDWAPSLEPSRVFTSSIFLLSSCPLSTSLRSLVGEGCTHNQVGHC